jgi:hypothetical protein
MVDVLASGGDRGVDRVVEVGGPGTFAQSWKSHPCRRDRRGGPNGLDRNGDGSSNRALGRGATIERKGSRKIEGRRTKS